jgi:mono/diheme cytochrome c family protein
VGGSAAAQTAATDIGKLEFNNNCAVCHGTTGKGDGPAGMYTTPPAADLTTISKRNNGLFPFARLYETIDGTRMAKGHGTREMPIWGNEYNAKAARMLGVFGTLRDQESFTRGRIVALIGYIYSLQKQ